MNLAKLGIYWLPEIERGFRSSIHAVVVLLASVPGTGYLDPAILCLSVD